MTDIELITKIEKATKPSDIFPDEWKSLYRDYCKLIHPDSNPDSNKNLVVTCLDQVPDKFPVTIGEKQLNVDTTYICNYLGIQQKFLSYSDKGVD